MTRSDRSWPWWRWALSGLSVLALAVSAYLAWHSVAGGTVIGCGGSGCDQVLGSRWSTIGGVLPVSGLAAGTYLALLLASLYIGPATAAPVRQLAWRAMLVLIGAAAGSAVWFLIVQKWIIGAFCPYCMAAHTIGILLAVLIIWRAPRNGRKSEMRSWKSDRSPKSEGMLSEIPLVKSHREPARRTSGFGSRVWALVGLALAGVLAATQALLTPAPVYRAGESQSMPAVIDAHAAPLVGSPDALYVVKLLFDYKCPHCQQLHFMLKEVVRQYGGKLAFALCPTPLNTRCNPYVPRDVDEFANSCELARLALAVWLANREDFSAFELWMFTLESGDRWQPRTLEQARARAVELTGQAELDAALADPWIDRHLKTSVQLFADTGSNAIPKLVFGSRWVIPQSYDADGLISILHDTLGVPAP